MGEEALNAFETLHRKTGDPKPETPKKVGRYFLMKDLWGKKR